MKKTLSMVLALLMLASFAACGKKTEPDPTRTTENTEAPAAAMEITALLASPAQAEAWQTVCEAYREQSGVTVRATTVSRESYAETLNKKLAEGDAPVIFEVNAQTDAELLKKTATDLSGTSLYSFLSDPTLAHHDGDKALAVPIDVSGFGIIANEDVTDRYFALANKKTSYSSLQEINSFSKLKALAEDLQAHKKELGIEGVFASPAFAESDSSVWQREFANAALVREGKAKGDDLSDVKSFLSKLDMEKSANELRTFYDLWIANGDADKKELQTRTAAEAQAAFAAGKTAFLIESTDSSRSLLSAEGGVLKEEKLALLPLLIGEDGEEGAGLSVRVERALAVNDKADAEHRQAAVDFLEWLFSSEAGKALAVKRLGLRVPFNTFEDGERGSDPLALRLLTALGRGVKAVPELLDRLLPDETLKSVSGRLLSYTRGERSWDELMRDMKAGWAKLTDMGEDAMQRSDLLDTSASNG